MSRSAVLAAQARADLRAELAWLVEAEQLARARALRDEVPVAARRLGERPRLGRVRLELLPEPYRFWSMTRFQMLLVYNPTTSPPRILRLLNTARDLAKLLEDLES